MKKLLALFTVVLMAVSVLALGACRPRDKNDVDLDEEGNPTGDAVANVEFWGWGDPDEVAVFNRLTNEFNAQNKNIQVKYIQKPSDGYSSTTAQALQGRHGPDVFYVGDGDLKQWASLDLLAPLDDYLTKSKEVVPEEMWDNSLQRYRYDKVTQQSRPTDPLFAVPKDIGPTVIYYNKTAFESVGVSIISIDEEDIDTYNSEHGTNYLKKGYYELDGGGGW